MNKINSYTAIFSEILLKTNLTKNLIDKIFLELNNEEKKSMEKDCIYLVVDAESIVSIKHLICSIYFAIKAFKQKNNIANTLNSEILLYLSGHRQISKAINKVGLSSSTKAIIFIKLIKGDTIQHPNLRFNFGNFLKQNCIEYDNLKVDINDLATYNEKAIMKNYGLNEKMIKLLVSDSDEEYSYKKIIEKLVIEKSALLNLEK